MPTGIYRAAIAITLFLVLAVARPNGQSSTTPLTNADVVKMVAARLGDPVIITAIESSPRRNFDLSIDGLIALKQAGVSDAVIVVMQKLVAEKAPAPALSPPPAATVAPAAPHPTPAPAARARVTPQEPSGVFEPFRVNLATGELIPLEKVKPKEPRFSSIKTVHFEGAASPVVFKYGEPLVFATRTFFRPDQLRKETSENLTYRLEHLAVKDGKRFASRVYVLLAAEEYGTPVLGLSGGKGKNDLPAYAYLLKPITQLPPGEYAFTYGGMLNGFPQGAFAIADR